VDDFTEMLGRMDLHRVLGSKGCADRVCAGADFVPECALDEVHRVGRRRADLCIALDPQQQTVGVADDDQVFALVGDAPSHSRTNGAAASSG
jgi:hypothetical protein